MKSNLPARIHHKLRGTGLEGCIKNYECVGAKTKVWIELLSDEYTCFEAAEKALSTAGGLEFDLSSVHNLLRAGRDFARLSFCIDPTLWSGESEYLAYFEQFIHSRLYPLGDCDRGTHLIAVDEEGRAYMIGDSGITMYPNIEDLIISIMNGIRGTSIPVKA